MARGLLDVSDLLNPAPRGQGARKRGAGAPRRPGGCIPLSAAARAGDLEGDAASLLFFFPRGKEGGEGGSSISAMYWDVCL